MEFISRLPKEIRQLLTAKGFEREIIGRQSDFVCAVGKEMYLKISLDVSMLTREKECDLWLENRLTAPKVLNFGKLPAQNENEPSAAFLLTSRVAGERLCEDKFRRDPDYLTSLLAEAMATFHALPFEDCPFIAERSLVLSPVANTVCHGDFCLPNLLADEKGNLGFVDLSDMGKGDPWLDIAWCVWSLLYNLKTDRYRDRLLQKLGVSREEENYQTIIQA